MEIRGSLCNSKHAGNEGVLDSSRLRVVIKPASRSFAWRILVRGRPRITNAGRATYVEWAGTYRPRHATPNLPACPNEQAVRSRPRGARCGRLQRGIITEHLKMGNVSKHSQSRDFYLAIKQKMQKCECCRGLHQIVTCLHCHMECVATS